MLKRIEMLKNMEQPTADENIEPEEQVPAGMSVTGYRSGIEKGKPTVLKEYEGIQSIEDALTRVQARRQRAIEALHKFGYDDARLELATMQLEFEMSKQDVQQEETGDDGFLSAMNAVAQEVWGDESV